ncbi:unnamed protein product [Protopolystoma xenopodis]|uniref:Uncharacterized protein n=1 Tax=Protopolystoma xenopodis TaxID=117903 RepID=A0A3S5BR21_9PLAT|nr:unnamed protein product [Protopolystoma xenopodis]
MNSSSDDVHQMMDKNSARFRPSEGGCLVDYINLNVVLKPNSCYTIGLSRPLLVRSAYKSLLHSLSYEMKLSPTLLFQETHQNPVALRVYK